MFVRHFTLEEANALVPLVVESSSRIRALMARTTRLKEELARGVQAQRTSIGAGSSELETVRRELVATSESIGEEVAGIHALGGLVKGLDPLLVDFPANLDGKTVLLCWKDGETRIDHFHLLETGFSSRRPVEDAAAFGRTVVQ